MSGVVLVHGLWHEPRHFDLVADGLRDRGIEVAVPELHRGSLRADTDAVQAAVDAMSDPPVALGHSYGGSVITGLVNVAALVFVAAFVPDENECTAILGGPAPLIEPALVRRDGATEVDPALAGEALYGDCPPDRAAWAISLLRPQRSGHGRGVPHRVAWRDTPSTYAICAADRAIDPALQREMARRCGSIRTWPTSHSPFLSRPDLVVDLLTEVRAALKG